MWSFRPEWLEIFLAECLLCLFLQANKDIIAESQTSRKFLLSLSEVIYMMNGNSSAKLLFVVGKFDDLSFCSFFLVWHSVCLCVVHSCDYLWLTLCPLLGATRCPPGHLPATCGKGQSGLLTGVWEVLLFWEVLLVLCVTSFSLTPSASRSWRFFCFTKVSFV